MSARIGYLAPDLKVSVWVSGPHTNVRQERGRVIFIEIFQVNCPGCFLYGIPEAIRLFNKYKDKNLSVLGLATAFEDYDKNTVENLTSLVHSARVIGETRKVLGELGQLVQKDKLSFKIAFPVCMDLLVNKENRSQLSSESELMYFIKNNIDDFDSYSETHKQTVIKQVKKYLTAKQYSALNFEEYHLRGTPSSILIDKKGILRYTGFGANDFLEDRIVGLLDE